MTATAATATARTRPAVVTGLEVAAGPAVGVALAGWAYVSAADDGGDPLPVAALAVAAVATVLAARWVGSRWPWVVPAVVAAVGGAVLLWGGTPSPHHHGPLGYANATGAFAALTVAGAAMVLVAAPWIALRLAALVPLVVGVLVPSQAGALAATVTTVALVVAVLGAAGGRARQAVVAGAAVVALAAIGLTTWLGASYTPARAGALDGIVDATLSERRPMLWGDAVSIMVDHPYAGIGPGRFREVAPTSLADADAGWAHNEWLQLGAELGFPGYVAAVALVAWVLVLLLRGPQDHLATLAALAVAGLVLNASIDYVLHFPAVTLAGAALAGAGARRSM